jgi:acyl-coenzyme A synthetase/AMP-(fatty) acid ligase
MRWFRTGDRVVATPEHGFVFLGRTDTQAKIGGHRVELQEIEEVVRCAANCDLVAALPWPVDADGLASGVLVFLTASAVPDEAILAACRDRLPLYMVPACLRRVADWPLNPNGKTDRKQLAALAKEMD